MALPDEPVSGDVLPPSRVQPPVRVSVRDSGFVSSNAVALGRQGAAVKAAEREALRAQVEAVLSGMTQEVALFALAMIQEGIDEMAAAKAQDRYPDQHVMRRSERAVDRWFDRILGKPTQSMTVESKQDIFVLLASVVKGVANGDG